MNKILPSVIKGTICLLYTLFLLAGCGKDETPDRIVEELPDPATAIVITAIEGQHRSFSVFNPNGSLRWKLIRSTVGGLGINPSYGDSKLYTSYGDTVYAHNIQDGSVVWKTRNWSTTLSTPTLYNGVLYLPALHSLYELSPQDGSVLKKHAISQVAGFPAIIKDSIVYLITSTNLGAGSIIAYDLKSQTVKWTTAIGINSPIDLKLVGENLIFRNDISYHLKAIDIKTGQFAWTKTESGGYRNHNVSGDKVFAVPNTGTEYLHFLAFDAKTGEKQWKWTQNKTTRGIVDIHVYKDQVTFMISEPDSKVAYLGVKSSNGDSLWRRNELRNRLSYASELAGDRIYRYEETIGLPHESKLVAYEAKTFTPLDSSQTIINDNFLFLKVIKKSEN